MTRARFLTIAGTYLVVGLSFAWIASDLLMKSVGQ